MVLCALAVPGQSGRHVRKPAAAPVATPEQTPTVPKAAEKPKVAFTFIVAMDRYGDFSRLPLYVFSGVLRSCANRLDQPDSVNAAPAKRDMSRTDAVRQAEEERETYVVWLQLRPNNLSGRTNGRDDSYDVDVEYAVFAPITGRQVTSGRTFPGAYRNKGVIKPKVSAIDGDEYLNRAARAAADRILITSVFATQLRGLVRNGATGPKLNHYTNDKLQEALNNWCLF